MAPSAWKCAGAVSNDNRRQGFGDIALGGRLLSTRSASFHRAGALCIFGCREHETSRHHMSPSLKLDCLWHWMLLNTDVSSCVHEALGGVVPHSTSTESDSLKEKNERRRRSMELMTSMGYSPDPELWTDDCGGTQVRGARQGGDATRPI